MTLSARVLRPDAVTEALLGWVMHGSVSAAFLAKAHQSC